MTLTLKAPINNGRDSKGSHDRLIMNRFGESVRAMQDGKLTRIQTTMIITDRTPQPIGSGMTVEVMLEKREAIAFILQIATMIGVACEVTE